MITRYLIEVYRVEIPSNAKRRDDLIEATEDWLHKAGKDKCFMYQMQSDSLSKIGERLKAKKP